MCQEPQNKVRDLLPPHAGIKNLPNSESQTGLCGLVTQAGRRPRSPALTPRPVGCRAFPGTGLQHNSASLQLRSRPVLIAHLNPDEAKPRAQTLAGGSSPSCTPHLQLLLLNWPMGAAPFTSKPSRARDPPSGAPRAAWATWPAGKADGACARANPEAKGQAPPPGTDCAAAHACPPALQWGGV